jgi:hypothetical protein
MADIGGSQTESFGSGHTPMANPGRANASSITMGDAASSSDQGLDQTSWHCDTMSPRGVLQTALSAGSPAITTEAVELGQSSLGDQQDADMAQQGIQRSMMQRAGQIGSSDGVE